MAVVNLNTTKISLVKNAVTADMTVLGEVAGDATDGCYFTPTNGSGHYIVYANNTNAATTARTCTVKGSDGMFGSGDLASGNIAAGKSKLISINDVGQYMIRSGTYKGQVKIEVSNAEVKLAVIELPM